jgi:D-3-phosphoglycerate dehydrogenase
MLDTIDTLILDLLEWIGPGSRPYAEVIEAWRTSCPRLPIWEDANELGFVTTYHQPGLGILVTVTPVGTAFLHAQRSAQLA